MAAKMKAIVNADMNGEAMVLGKKALPSKVFTVVAGRLAASGPHLRLGVCGLGCSLGKLRRVHLKLEPG